VLNMPRIFLISDNHFSDYDGPDGIIPLLNRKFDNSAEMNATMIKRWNNAVQKNDTVFNLGDFAWLKNEMVKYANQLNGHKYFILGNHDFEGNRWWLNEENYDNAVFSLMSVLTYKNRDFLLIHRPEDVPSWWRGWVIHGHHHMMLPKYPFIDGKYRNINVCCELVDYTPVDLDWILSLDIDSIKRMDTAKSTPIKW
jgi:calcineurin-like phosphoesterase family protein